MFDGLGSSAQHIKSGRISALAVAAQKRAPGFPDMPTSGRGGPAELPGRHLVRPLGAQRHAEGTIERMNAELKKAFASEEIRDAWTGLGSEIPTLTGSAFGEFVNAEATRWAAVVKAGNIKMD